jgi:hypothetical protein
MFCGQMITGGVDDASGKYLVPQRVHYWSKRISPWKCRVYFACKNKSFVVNYRGKYGL